MRTKTLLAAALAVLGAAVPAAARADGVKGGPGTEPVLLVGNNWDGTADVVDPKRYERILRINIVPDLAIRRAEIMSDPVATGFFLGIRQLIGEGHDQLVDDMFSSPHGRFMYVSRPSLDDVVAFNLRTRKIAWRVKFAGSRADHMAISPDGKRLLVSASTAGVVHVIDTRLGKIVTSFPSGTSRTRATTRATARPSTTRASARCTRPPTTPPRTRARASATSRPSTRRPTGSSRGSRLARSWPRPATPT